MGTSIETRAAWKVVGCAVLLAQPLLALGCGGDAIDESLSSGAFAPEAGDEAFDPADPPTNPDPIGIEEVAAAATALNAQTTDESNTASWDELKKGCAARPEMLSPKGLTFVIHVSEYFGADALQQLKAVQELIRPRDIFMIERKAPVIHALRKAFPCNAIHFIAYPDEFHKALEAGDLVDGIAIDWETNVAAHPQSWSIHYLHEYTQKIRAAGRVPGVVPSWPAGFNDGHVVRASKMRYDLAQIQGRCRGGGPAAFASGARGLLYNFKDSGLTPRDIGFEISLDSFASASNHTDVDRSADCTRKAYGKGARAIYLYGNGHPHLKAYFEKMAAFGLRNATSF